MRWYVEIAPVGKETPLEKLCLEASHWQPALQQARRERGEDDRLSGLSVEFLDDGCKAIDARLHLAYRVSRAPEDAPLRAAAKKDRGDDASGEAPDRPSAERAAGQDRASRRGRRSKKRISAARAGAKKVAKTMVLGSTGEAELREDIAKATAKSSTPAERPSSAQPAKSRTMMGMAPDRASLERMARGADRRESGQSAVAAAAKTLPQGPASEAKPAAVIDAMVQPPPPEPAPPPAPYEVANRREIASSDRRPLTYRELSLFIELPLKLTTLRAVASHALEGEKHALAESPAGRVLKLAVFDHAFDEAPRRPPLLTLSWHDWHDEPTIVFFPYAERPAASLEAARVLIGGGEMLTADNAPKPVTAAELKQREEAKARADAERAETDRRAEEKKRAEAEEQKRADEARRRAAEAARASEAREAQKKRDAEEAQKKRDAESQREQERVAQARARELEEKSRRDEETQRALAAKKREEAEAAATAKPGPTQPSPTEASPIEAKEATEGASPGAEPPETQPKPRAASRDAAQRGAAKTFSDGTPSRRSGSRRSIADRKRRTGDGPRSSRPADVAAAPEAATGIAAAAPARTDTMPSHRARPSGSGRAASRPPSVSFEEPISRAQRDKRHAAARERAESLLPPPSLRGKRVGGDQLIADLFEAMSELFFLNDALEAAHFVLHLAMEKLPCEAGIVSLFDIDKQQFVVVRQTGGERSALLLRIPDSSPLQRRAMRKRHAIVVPRLEDAPDAADVRWKTMGVEVRSLICAPVEKSGRYLGLVELANPYDGKAFDESDGNALTYIGEQYAEFLDQRGILLDPDAIVANAESMPR